MAHVFRTFTATSQAVFIASLLASCEQAPNSPPTSTVASTELCAPAPKRPEGVWIAGTGAGIAPLRMLADAYASEANSLPIHVPVSIGTSGGLRALEAGEIDPSFVVTHPTSLEDAPEMYKKFRDKEDEVIKVVMRPHD